jgi:hypothetical protein
LEAQERDDMKGRTVFTESGARAEWAKRRADVVAQRKQVQDQLSAFNSRADAAVADPAASIALALSQIDQRIRDLEARRDQNSKLIAERAAVSQRSVEGDVRAIDARKREVQLKYSQLQEQAQAEYDAEMKALANTQATVRQLQADRNQLEAQRLHHRNLINQKVSENQVYRIAQFWFGRENAADVTRDELRLTAFVWFGSLAAIVAATGTILAFAGVLLMYEQTNTKKPNRVLRAIRGAAIEFRRHLRTPKTVTVKETVEVEREKIVEVVKEVPVEKIVFREVPREIVRKELVYVPLYTNDDKLLRKPKTEIAEVKDVGRGAISVEAD